MGNEESNPATNLPKLPPPPSRNELIGRAAIDWCLGELDDAQLVETLRGSLHSAFSDGAYWAIQQIEAGRIKVKVKGGGA